MAPVEDALIVAGGLGARMFPASAMLAKEALPLVDVPVLTHLMHEAVHAGATRIHIISRPGKDLGAWREGRNELAPLRPEEASSFGMVAMRDGRITEVVEKPAPGEAPSDLALCGRYLWTEDAAALLERYDVDTHGELQSIRVQEHWMQEGGMVGVVHEEAMWYDAGRPLPWLKAQIDHALRREDLGEDLETWLKSRLA